LPQSKSIYYEIDFSNDRNGRALFLPAFAGENYIKGEIMTKILNIIDTAYRATLEEQDDTSLWFIEACTKAGATMNILLTGNAVNYAVKDQNTKSLHFGSGAIPHPSKFQDDISRFCKSGAHVFLLKDDAEERGIPQESIIPDVEYISRDQLARFIDKYDHVWHW